MVKYPSMSGKHHIHGPCADRRPKQNLSKWLVTVVGGAVGVAVVAAAAAAAAVIRTRLVDGGDGPQ
uniref:Uncharacterized protein n=1 Tax=Octopus bimaculoides TaxID=37653 RepID=A0A0L8FIR4_OCTBM